MDTREKDNKRMGRRVAFWVTMAFVLVISAWTILITIAVKNQPEKISIEQAG
ncbi:MAG: hypothetical protein ACPGN3_16170 [Opitutales bacterium]